MSSGSSAINMSSATYAKTVTTTTAASALSTPIAHAIPMHTGGHVYTSTDTAAPGPSTPIQHILGPHTLDFSSPLSQQRALPLSSAHVPVSMPVPYSPAISDNDVMRIALQVRDIMRDEIDKLVTAKVTQATAELWAEVNQLKAANTELMAQVDEVKFQMDDLEQYSRRSSVRISGIKEEASEDLFKVVMDLSNDIKANISPRDIDRLHRVGRQSRGSGTETATRPRDIIVKFTNSSARLAVLKCRKTLRDRKASVYINEDLTSFRMGLSYECRMLKRDKRIRNVWTFNGNVFVEDNTGNRQKIIKPSDLNVFK